MIIICIITCKQKYIFFIFLVHNWYSEREFEPHSLSRVLYISIAKGTVYLLLLNHRHCIFTMPELGNASGVDKLLYFFTALFCCNATLILTLFNVSQIKTNRVLTFSDIIGQAMKAPQKGRRNIAGVINKEVKTAMTVCKVQ